MGIDAHQLRTLVIVPTIRRLGLYSKAAENLLMGTAAQESHLGTYLHQLGKGPAKGIFQMEPATHSDCWANYLRYREGLAEELRQIAGVQTPTPELMIGNLYYATAMARVHYLRVSEALPKAENPYDLGHYYKDHYNTHLGKATVDEFVANYRHYVLER